MLSTKKIPLFKIEKPILKKKERDLNIYHLKIRLSAFDLC